MKEGEVSILGGLISQVDQKTLNGWPGLAKIPIFRYLFSDDRTQRQEDEVLIVLTPRVVRLPDWTRANLQTDLFGNRNLSWRKTRDGSEGAFGKSQSSAITANGAATWTGGIWLRRILQLPIRLRLILAEFLRHRWLGQEFVLNLNLEFSSWTDSYGGSGRRKRQQTFIPMPMLLQYNPAVISVEEVRHGGFLSGGTQEIAIVQRVDKEHGQAIISATRQPNTPGVNGTGTIAGNRQSRPWRPGSRTCRSSR